MPTYGPYYADYAITGEGSISDLAWSNAFKIAADDNDPATATIVSVLPPESAFTVPLYAGGFTADFGEETDLPDKIMVEIKRKRSSSAGTVFDEQIKLVRMENAPPFEPWSIGSGNGASPFEWNTTYEVSGYNRSLAEWGVTGFIGNLSTLKTYLEEAQFWVMIMCEVNAVSGDVAAEIDFVRVSFIYGPDAEPPVVNPGTIPVECVVLPAGVPPRVGPASIPAIECVVLPVKKPVAVQARTALVDCVPLAATGVVQEEPRFPIFGSPLIS